MSTKLGLLALLYLLVLPFETAAQVKRLPIIDMHVHAEELSEFGGGGVAVCTDDQEPVLPGVDPKNGIDFAKAVTCRSPILSSSTDEELMRETFSAFRKYNIRRAVAFGPLKVLEKWRKADEGVLIPALNFVDRDVAVSEYRRFFREGRLRAFAEVTAQYRGLRPDDPTLAPYFELAQELDIPVGIHLGEGPPGGAHTVGSPTFRARLGSPYLLEEVLVKYPKLRIYVMHYGSPNVDEMISMLYHHPQLYVDIAANNWGMPRKQFHDHLRRLVEAGMVKRIMFGSDQMIWPQTIGEAIETVERAAFLTQDQKRDIFYNNAARFLRLSEDEIRKDHSN